MAHSRQTIRDGVAALLTGLPRTGSRVYASRVRPVASSEMPALCVYTLEEDVQRQSVRPTLLRQVSLVVAIYDEGPDGDVMDGLDDSAAEVEARMGADKSLGIAGVLDSQLVKTMVAVPELANTEKIAPTLSLVYRVQYRTTAADATTMV